MAQHHGLVHSTTIDIVRGGLDPNVKVSDAEIAMCANILGSFYAVAEDVPQDMELFAKAAIFGNGVAVTALADMINCGLIDPSKANTYVENAIKTLEELDRQAAAESSDEDEDGMYQQTFNI